MNRRDLLRAISIAGTLAMAPPGDNQLDHERLLRQGEQEGPVDSALLDQYTVINARLWQTFAAAKPKWQAWSAVRTQLDVLTEALRRPQTERHHARLCALAADLFQLAGEVLFDGSHYPDAAHCYTLAAMAAKEGGAFDLWACALSRHAFIGVYERQPQRSEPLLDLAAAVARNGDTSLSTRYWVQAVAAQTYAGLGQADACRAALDEAEQVRNLAGKIHNGGWLRFDASRLTEERGSCYTDLGLTDLAETALSQTLTDDLSLRRRGSVLTDLALVGAQRRDPDQVIMYANAALDTARQRGSGVVVSKLQRLQTYLARHHADRHIQYLSKQIDALTIPTTNNG